MVTSDSIAGLAALDPALWGSMSIDGVSRSMRWRDYTRMLDRPPVADAEIARAIESAYAGRVSALEFLALGHDIGAWTFRARLSDGRDLFVKLRRSVDPARLRACRYLAEHGLPEIVAPSSAREGQLAVAVGALALIAYPFLDAPDSVTAWPTLGQWRAYGDFVRRLHGSVLPAALADALPRESFRSRQLADVPTIDALVAEPGGAAEADGVDGPWAEVAASWQRHSGEILELAACAGELAESIRSRTDPARLVPCHGDIHTYNVLVDASGGLCFIDWDELLLAPRERDLMFILGSPMGPRRPAETEAFLGGYGPVVIDAERLAYYHAEWAIQDLVGYALDSRDAGASAASRNAAARTFEAGFDAGGQVEVGLAHVRALAVPRSSQA